MFIYFVGKHKNIGIVGKYLDKGLKLLAISSLPTSLRKPQRKLLMTTSRFIRRYPVIFRSVRPFPKPQLNDTYRSEIHYFLLSISFRSSSTARCSCSSSPVNLTQVIRGVDVCDMPSRRWNKPSIMVQCEANYSNAHGTPWVYKHKKLGKLVGMPVPGTMTSVNWITMQDPTLVHIRDGRPTICQRRQHAVSPNGDIEGQT